MIEYEAKILDIDPDDIQQRILDAGGKYIGSAMQRRLVFDITPGDQSRWIRLRDNGTTVTLAAKVIRHSGLDGTDEEEIVVDDFDTAHRLLQLQGFTAKAHQENRRTSLTLKGAQLEVDEWPGIPPYLEVEGRDRAHVVEVAALLGFHESALTGENTTAVYARYGIDLASITDLRF